MSRSDPPLCERLSYADFLCLKEPWGISTALPGDSKAQFMARIGLSEAFPEHDEIYSKMEGEAIRAKQILFSEPAALMPDTVRRGKPGPPEPPYSVEEIREDAFLKAISSIYDSACPYTQNIYALVGAREDNWIIRWMLFHVITEEYRKANLVAEQYPLQRLLLGGHSPPASTDYAVFSIYGSTNRYFDDHLTTTPGFYSFPSPLSDDLATGPLDQEPRPASRSSRSSYWDPIRDK